VTYWKRKKNGVKQTTMDMLRGYGDSDRANIIRCPHCGSVGGVSTHRGKVKKGISGGKATGAVLTGGLSVGFTGLSRKERAIALDCAHCGMEWIV
jgi:hypothetical protein